VTPTRPGVAYKVLSGAEFSRLRDAGSFAGSEADRADGFIHMSTADQLTETIARHYRDRGDLVVAAVDLAQLGDAVRWEISRGDQEFPHLYGALPIDAVTAAVPLARGGDGEVILPG